MKIFKLFVLITILGMLMVSCSPAAPQDNTEFIEKATQANPEKTETSTKYTIALVMKTLTNPFFIDMEKGARKAENQLGIHLIVKTAAQETSIQQQIEIVEELIKARVDAIVIAPGDSMELIPALKKAQDAGIVVVNIDNRLDEASSKQLGLKDVPFISVDNKSGGYLSAKYISDQVKTPAKAVILEGIIKARNAQDRSDGAKKAFQENPNINLVAVETANWKIDEAHDVIARLFQANPDIKAIFCSNDMMALGVIQYLDENNLNNVLVAGFDNLQEAQKAIREGKLQNTIDQQAALQGYTGVEYAVKILKGDTVALETLVNVILVTKDTLK
jgi:ribose transport system substrate-binding protein